MSGRIDSMKIVVHYLYCHVQIGVYKTICPTVVFGPDKGGDASSRGEI